MVKSTVIKMSKKALKRFLEGKKKKRKKLTQDELGKYSRMSEQSGSLTTGTMPSGKLPPEFLDKGAFKNGGEIKPKKKPLSPRQKALIDSANRIRKLEAAEERTKGITPKVKPKKPKLANGGLVSGKAQAKKYFTGVF